MVLEGAQTVYDCDPEEAARMLIEVVRMAYFADDAPQLGRTADLIDALSLPGDHPLIPMLSASAILARLQSGVPEDRVPPLPDAVREIQPERLGMTIGNLAIHAAFLRMVVDDAEEAWAQTGRMLVEARERGMIGGLPHIMLQHAQAALVSGHLQEALRTASEGVEIAEDTGQLHSAANLRGVLARITAMTGDEDTCATLAHEAVHSGKERHSSGVGLAVLALAVLDLKGVDEDKYVEDHLIGTPDEVCAKVAAFEEAGLDAFYATLFVADTVDEMLHQMRLFARYVLAAFPERLASFSPSVR